MDWIIECDVDLSTANSEEDMGFMIERIRDVEKIKKRFSILTEFYVSFSARFPDSITSIYLKESNISDELLETVVAHFEETKIIKEKDKPVEIMLAQPKIDSINQIKNNPGNQIVKNLFNLNSLADSSDEWLPKKTYKIEPQKIQRYDDKEFDNVLPYLTPPKNQPFLLLSISDWFLDDSLKNALAIRYFVHKFKEVYLWVDTNKRVTHIQLVLR